MPKPTKAIGREIVTPEDFEEWQCACEEAADFTKENTVDMPQPEKFFKEFYNNDILEIARIACEQLRSDYLCGQMDISDDYFVEVRDYINCQLEEKGIEVEDIKGLQQKAVAIAALQAVVDGTPDEVFDTHMQNILDRCYAAIKEIEAKE